MFAIKNQKEKFTGMNTTSARLDGGASAVTDEYKAYLLRLWHVEDDGGRWRAQLEDVETGEQHGFASLARLIEFFEILDGGMGPRGTESGEEE